MWKVESHETSIEMLESRLLEYTINVFKYIWSELCCKTIEESQVRILQYSGLEDSSILLAATPEFGNLKEQDHQKIEQCAVQC